MFEIRFDRGIGWHSWVAACPDDIVLVCTISTRAHGSRGAVEAEGHLWFTGVFVQIHVHSVYVAVFLVMSAVVYGGDAVDHAVKAIFLQLVTFGRRGCIGKGEREKGGREKGERALFEKGERETMSYSKVLFEKGERARFEPGPGRAAKGARL